MKKKLAVLLCVTLLMTLMLPVFSASAALGPQWVYAANGLPVKLRAQPSQDAAVLTKINYGTRLTNCSYYNSQWTKVTYNGYSGYMMTKFLVSYEPPYYPVYPTSAPTAKPVPTIASIFANMRKVDYYAVVSPTNGASFGNMRWAPSEDYPVISVYYPGYQLRVLYTNGTWYQVLDEASGKCGFMRNFLLQPIQYGAVGAQN